MKMYRILMSVFLLFISTFVFAQSNVGVNSVTITFSTVPSTFSVQKAPLKYNKDFAYGMHLDDGAKDIYTHAYQLLNGGVINGTTYPGLSYTDGCGNYIKFKMSTALFSFNGWGLDCHDPNSNYALINVTWPELNEMYQNGWGIYNHGINSDAGNYDYSIPRNHSFVKLKTQEATPGGVDMSVFVNPNGDAAGSPYAFQYGYLVSYRLGYSFGYPSFDVTGNWNHRYFDMGRSAFSENESISDIVDGIAFLSINGAHHWGVAFSHSVTNSNYGISFDKFKTQMNYVENTYGKNGLDNIWMATEEEVLEYLIIKDTLTINSQLNGNVLTITFQGNLPTNFSFYALSLLVDADVDIQSVQVDGGTSVSYNGIGTKHSLINLNWNGKIVIPPEQTTNIWITKTETSHSQNDADIAIDYLLMTPRGPAKDSLRQRMCAIPGITLPDGMCSCQTETGNNQAICAGDCVTLTATGSGFCLWSTGNTTFSITTCPTHDTTYYATVTNPYGCTSTDSVNVFMAPPPTVNAGEDMIICANANCQLNGFVSQQGTFNWATTGDGIFSSFLVINPVYTPGINDKTLGNVKLILTATAIPPCMGSSSDTLLLTIVPLPTANAGSDVTICQNDSYQLTATTNSAQSILWSTTGDGIFDSLSILNAVYSPGTNDITNGFVHLILTAEAINPCQESVSDTMDILIAKLPAVDAGSDSLVCEGFQTLLSGTALYNSSVLWSTSGDGNFSDPGILNSWYIPSNNDILNGNVELTLNAYSIPPCNGFSQDNVLLTIIKKPRAFAGNDTVICENQSCQLIGNAINQRGVYWTSTGDGIFDNDTVFNPMYTPGQNDIVNGEVTLILNADAIIPCQEVASDSIDLSISPVPFVNAGSDETICKSDSLVLNGIAIHQSSVLWSTSGDGIFTDAYVLNPTYIPGQNDISKRTVNLILKAYAISPCQDFLTDTMVLHVISSPIVEAGTDGLICENAAYHTQAFATDFSSVYWTSSGDGTFSNPDSIATFYYPGNADILNGAIKLIITAYPQASCGSQISDSLNLIISRLPEPDAGADQTICQNSTASLNGTANHYNSLWWSSSGDGYFSNPYSLSTNYFPGNYDKIIGSAIISLHTTGLSGCNLTVSDNLILTMIDVPDKALTPEGDISICYNTLNSNYFTSGADNATIYLWDIYPPEAGSVQGDSTVANVTWNQNFFGSAEIRVAGINNCGMGIFSDFLFLMKYPRTNVNILVSPDTIVCDYQLVTLDATTPNAISYLWLPGCQTQPVIYVDSTGNVGGIKFEKVLVSDIHDCQTSDSVKIYFVSCTGIAEKTNNKQFELYPNPAKNEIFIKSPDYYEHLNCEIVDLTGKLLITAAINSDSNLVAKKIDLHNLNKGLYIVKISGNNIFLVKKLVIY